MSNQQQYPCSKCNGTGKIGCFAHVLEGTCFNCKGTGLSKTNPENTKVGAGAILRKYNGCGFFYSTPEMKSIICLHNQGHPTAETWLFETDSNYYIGQPIAHGSTWFRIPKQMDEVVLFNKAYNKIYKQNPLPY